MKGNPHIKSIKVIVTLSDGAQIINGFELTKRQITDPAYDVRDIFQSVFNRLREGVIDQVTGTFIRKYRMGRPNATLNLQKNRS